MSLALKLALSPLLVAQSLLTRARMPRLPEAEGPRSGQVGRGPDLRLLVAGDSSAAGVGVALQQQALAAPLAALLAEQRRVRVHWTLLAQTGLSTAQTLELLQRQPQPPLADLAVVVTGVNDVTGQVPSQRALAAREALANWLRNAAGVQHVAFTPLPPVHRFPGLPQPLRWVAGADARRHNRALRDWAGRRGDVSCVELDLLLQPSAMAGDGFHPGPLVYRSCAEAIARHLAALDWRSEHDIPNQETRR
ncbi:MAG: SGNH/GDSL hydrolase family protein [Rubrivivax sp.]